MGLSRGCDSKNIRLLVQILPDQETGRMQPESGYLLPIKLSLRNLFILARPRPIKCPVAFQNSTAIQDHARHPVGNTLYLNRNGIIITLLSAPSCSKEFQFQYNTPPLLCYFLICFSYPWPTMVWITMGNLLEISNCGLNCTAFWLAW